MEAVEAGVEDAEGGHVGGRVGEVGELVRVDGELLQVVELEAHCVWELGELVEIRSELFQGPVKKIGYIESISINFRTSSFMILCIITR